MDKQLKIYLHFTSATEEKSWENDFSRSFISVLKQIIPQTPTFISNLSIANANTCDPEISDSFKQSDAFVIILNNINNKLNSSELTFTDKLISKTEQKKEKNIFVAQRFNPKGNELPNELKKYPLFSFFELNPKTHEIVDFWQVGNDDYQIDFLHKLTDLVYAIKKCINNENSISNTPNHNLTIYLAEVSADQIKNRDRLKRSLMLSGFTVFPEISLTTFENYDAAVKKNMEECILSIHLMGELYGDTPEGSDYSFPELQNRCFQEILQNQIKSGAKETIQRIIWLPPQLEPFEEKQIQYLKRINREINTAEGTDLIQSTLSDLRILIDKKIALLSLAGSDIEAPDSNELLVVLDNYQESSATIIKETLLQKKIKFRFLNETAITHRYNQLEMMNTINKFPAYLVVNTKSDANWLSGVINLVARSKGYKGGRPNGDVGLFLKHSKIGFENSTFLSIEPYVYDETNLVEKLELFISNVKL